MIKVEVTETTAKTKLFTFQASSPDDDEALDAVRTAFMGDHVKRGEYVNSLKFVVEVNPNQFTKTVV